MNLLIIISSMLIAKSLPLPQAGSCFESNHTFYLDMKTILRTVDNILTNTLDRKQLFIDSAYNKCGIKISFNSSGYMNIYHGAIPKQECKLSDILCNSNYLDCRKAVLCCKQPALLGDVCNEKYKLKGLINNSNTDQERTKRIESCNADSVGPRQSCFQIVKLPRYNINTTIDTTINNNNTSIEPTNRAENLYTLLVVYMLPILYAIKSL